MHESNKEAWNLHAKRYYHENALKFDVVDYCGEYYPTDNDLKLIGDPAGLKVLELGSGSCNCGIALALQGGRFIFSTNHPIFMSIGATELWTEEAADPNYYYRGPVQWKWNEDDSFYFTTYRRPLMDYINGLTNNSFNIDRFIDLYPKVIDEGWDEKERNLRMRFPSLLVAVSTKKI